MQTTLEKVINQEQKIEDLNWGETLHLITKLLEHKKTLLPQKIQETHNE